MTKLQFVGLAVSILLSNHTLCQTINWYGNSESMLVGQRVSVLEDKANKLDIEQASASTNFTPYTKKILNFDGSNSVYWVKFSVQNQTHDSLLLEVAQAKLAHADLYYKNNTGTWQIFHAGYKINLDQKVIKSHYQVFPLSGNSKDFYLRFQANGSPIPLTIWKLSTYEVKMSNQKIIYGIYIGMMVFVMFINLFFCFSLKRIAYLHYSFLVFMLASFSAINDGYILYIFPNCDLNYWFMLNPILNQPNGLLYCIMFLQVRKYDPKLFRFAVVVLGYFTSYIFWHFFLKDMNVQLISPIHALFGILLEAILGIRVGINGNRLGYYFAFTYIVFFIFCATEVIYIRTGSPAYYFELSYVSIGIFFEAFILTYLLSKRFEWEKKESDNAKANALQLLFEKTQENERMYKEQNVILEQKVFERTSELIKEKKKSDDLLLNILPEYVAEELKATGSAETKSYDSVSVLFTDIKDFTKISQNQDPEKLVADLDFCFRAFDGIVKRNNLEKIKTIGDAYMCAGGLPIRNDSHAIDIVKAAIEIRDFMENLKKEKISRKEIFYEIRLGISSGPVIAGIVGSSKFVYDIWGDTVNTAARMEQNSEAGKINISEATYELVKDEFSCECRGEIDAKGKGKLKMYYING